MLDDRDFEIVKCFIDFLQPFYEATTRLSGIYYSTSVLTLHHIYDISLVFKKYDSLEFFSSIIDKMKENFLKYWNGVPMLYALAAVLDPRCKLRLVSKLIKKIGDNLEADVGVTPQEVQDALYRMFDSYSLRFGTQSVRASSSYAPSSSSSKMSSWQLLDEDEEDDHIASSSSLIVNRQELTTYLTTNHSYLWNEFPDTNMFNVLEWWKSQSMALPILSTIAKDLLSIPVSSVACEQVFSIAGNVLDERRSRLKGDILEALMCVKDWELARHRAQEQRDDWIEDFANFNI
jgi:hypothetical protein